jgi:hypothetical protein
MRVYVRHRCYSHRPCAAPQEWDEEFVFRAPPEQATLLLLKVWDANPLLHKEFLGQALVRLPSAYDDEDADGWRGDGGGGSGATAALGPSAARDPLSLPAAAGGVRWEEAWHKLTPGRKHADELARRLARQGRKRDDLGEVLLRVSRLPAEAEEAAAGRGASLAAPGDAGQEADPEAYLHVDISAARNLLPADIEKGRDALTSSDPYAVVKLWPTAAHEPDHASPLRLPLPRSVPVPALDRRVTLLPRIPGLTRDAPRDEEEDQSATKRRTRVINDSLDPVWDAAFAFRPAEDATHVKITVYDRDAVLNADDYLGEALIPLPARRGRDAPPLGDAPPPSAEERALAEVARRRGKDGEAEQQAARGIVEGWFPLRCDARHAGELTASSAAWGARRTCRRRRWARCLRACRTARSATCWTRSRRTGRACARRWAASRCASSPRRRCRTAPARTRTLCTRCSSSSAAARPPWRTATARRGPRRAPPSSGASRS